MEKRRLGKTGLFITPLGLGTWAMGGGDWAYGWGDQDDRESIDAIHRAVERGINWVDTAPVYGLGHAEEIVARALAELPPSTRPHVFTKCSLLWDRKKRLHHCLKSDSLRRELEASLRRLRVEAIDLYQIHWPSPHGGEASPDLEEGWMTLRRFQEEGKARYIGVSNFDVEQLEQLRNIAPIASLQPPYSLLNRGIESDILPYCERHHMGVIVYSPLQSGLLSGAMTRQRVASLPANDWRAKKSAGFQEPTLTRNLRFVEVLRSVGRRHGRSPAEVAIAWTLRHGAVTGAIVGARRPSQVEGFVGAAEFRLSDDDVAELFRELPKPVATSG